MNVKLEKVKELMRSMTEDELVTVKEHAEFLIEQIQFENEDTLREDPDIGYDDEYGFLEED